MPSLSFIKVYTVRRWEGARPPQIRSARISLQERIVFLSAAKNAVSWSPSAAAPQPASGFSPTAPKPMSERGGVASTYHFCPLADPSIGNFFTSHCVAQDFAWSALWSEKIPAFFLSLCLSLHKIGSAWPPESFPCSVLPPQSLTVIALQQIFHFQLQFCTCASFVCSVAVVSDDSTDCNPPG